MCSPMGNKSTPNPAGRSTGFAKQRIFSKLHHFVQHRHAGRCRVARKPMVLAVLILLKGNAQTLHGFFKRIAVEYIGQPDLLPAGLGP